MQERRRPRKLRRDASTRAAEKVAKVANPKWRVHVVGRVLDPDDKPVRGARVFALTQSFGSDNDALAETRTDDNGAFSLDIETPVVTYHGGGENHDVSSVVVQADGFALTGSKVKVAENLTEVKAGAPLQAEETVVKMRAPRVISDTLRDDQGKPAVGVTLRPNYFYVPDRRGSNIFSVPKALQSQYEAKTDANGVWKIAGFPDDAYVSVRIDDERYVPLETQYSPTGGTDRMMGGTLVAQRAGGVVGRVVGLERKTGGQCPLPSGAENGALQLSRAAQAQRRRRHV